jgi:hypothetical protein
MSCKGVDDQLVSKAVKEIESKGSSTELSFKEFKDFLKKMFAH